MNKPVQMMVIQTTTTKTMMTTTITANGVINTLLPQILQVTLVLNVVQVTLVILQVVAAVMQLPVTSGLSKGRISTRRELIHCPSLCSKEWWFKGWHCSQVQYIISIFLIPLIGITCTYLFLPVCLYQ